MQVFENPILTSNCLTRHSLLHKVRYFMHYVFRGVVLKMFVGTAFLATNDSEMFLVFLSCEF